MTLGQSAKNLDYRHYMITGVDCHIEKKTLDDYYSNIMMGFELKNPFDFKRHQHEEISFLRK